MRALWDIFDKIRFDSSKRRPSIRSIRNNLRYFQIVASKILSLSYFNIELCMLLCCITSFFPFLIQFRHKIKSKIEFHVYYFGGDTKKVNTNICFFFAVYFPLSQSQFNLMGICIFYNYLRINDYHFCI